MIAILPVQPAEAATKAYKTVDPNTPHNGDPTGPDRATADNPAYTQGKYFWFEYPGVICEYPKLMCSSKKGGKGAVCVINTADYQGGFSSDVPVDRRHRGIVGLLTNGTYLYFGMRDLYTGDTQVYRIKCDGTGLKKITKIPQMGNGYFISYYNGQIYYYMEWEDENYATHRNIRSVSLKTGKIYNRKSNAEPYDVKNSGGRYIAYTNENYESKNYNKTYIYDCKEKTTECIGNPINLRVSDGKLYYALEREEGGYDVYREAISGRGEPVHVATLKNANSIGQIGSKYIYWDKVFYEDCYRYNVETGKSKKVDIKDYKFDHGIWY